MNPYLTAIQALENCVKDAMENNVDATTQSEIWRHYQGVKAIAKILDKDKISFEVNTDPSTFTFDTSDTLSTNTVEFNLSSNPDVITFT